MLKPLSLALSLFSVCSSLLYAAPQDSFIDLCQKRESLPEEQRDFIDFLMTSNKCGHSLRILEKIPILYFKDTYVEWSLLKEAKSLHTLHLNTFRLESLNFLRGMSQLKELILEKVDLSSSADLMVLKQLPHLRTITIVASSLSEEQRFFLSRLNISMRLEW